MKPSNTRSTLLLSASTLLSVCASMYSSMVWSDPMAPRPTMDAQRPALASIVPGRSTKSSVRATLGEPWRIVQFDDCGMPMPGQADETWEYRGSDSKGSYRLHVEFDDRGTVTIAAKISDLTGDGTVAASPEPTMKMPGM